VKDAITIETDMFTRRPSRTRDGHDFVAWLLAALAPLEAAGFTLSDPVENDFGWGLWAVHNAGPFWVTLSCCTVGSDGAPAQWKVAIRDEPEFASPVLHHSDPRAFKRLRDEIWTCVAAEPAIRVLGAVH
jgi:hypothetical protein